MCAGGLFHQMLLKRILLSLHMITRLQSLLGTGTKAMGMATRLRSKAMVMPAVSLLIRMVHSKRSHLQHLCHLTEAFQATILMGVTQACSMTPLCRISISTNITTMGFILTGGMHIGMTMMRSSGMSDSKGVLGRMYKRNFRQCAARQADATISALFSEGDFLISYFRDRIQGCIASCILC